MFKVINQSGHTAYGLKEYICDVESDISNLPIDETPGSTAFVIASKKTYMMNNQHKWVDITVTFTSNSSGTSSSKCIDYTENFEELKSQTQTLITDNAVLKTQINDLTAHNQTLSENINSLSSSNEELKTSINNLITENNLLTEQVNILLDNNSSLIETTGILIEKIEILKLEIEALKESHNNDNDQDGGEIYLDGTMNMDNVAIEVNEESNTLIVDETNSEIVGNTLILN